MKRARFLSLWPLKYSAAEWTVVRIRLAPGRLAPLPPTAGFDRAAFAQHVMALKPRIEGRGFALVVEPPFVVLGDESERTVSLRAEKTVRWATQKLKQDFFQKDPLEIIDIWLFADKASYERNARELFHDQPTTPFGYYAAADHALVMNIATGGGTLVHEIVHPFVRANFPACPDWLNEGLGSLYEQSADRDGHICGLTNWRLEGLQASLRRHAVPSFEELTGRTGRNFYTEDRGANYAQARYLCYYLQEKGLLVKFYRDFVAGQKDDPTGYATLKRILQTDDMAAFQKQWEAFVMALRFP